jgi:hypothetical protein
VRERVLARGCVLVWTSQKPRVRACAKSRVHLRARMCAHVRACVRMPWPAVEPEAGQVAPAQRRPQSAPVPPPDRMALVALLLGLEHGGSHDDLRKVCLHLKAPRHDLHRPPGRMVQVPGFPVGAERRQHYESTSLQGCRSTSLRVYKAAALQVYESTRLPLYESTSRLLWGAATGPCLSCQPQSDSCAVRVYEAAALRVY